MWFPANAMKHTCSTAVIGTSTHVVPAHAILIGVVHHTVSQTSRGFPWPQCTVESAGVKSSDLDTHNCASTRCHTTNAGAPVVVRWWWCGCAGSHRTPLDATLSATNLETSVTTLGVGRRALGDLQPPPADARLSTQIFISRFRPPAAAGRSERKRFYL